VTFYLLLRRAHPILALIAGALSLALSISLIIKHVEVVREVKEVAVPLVATLPAMEKHLTVLKEQVELSELNRATEVGSIGERLNVYVLPRETDLQRLISTIELLELTLKKQNQLSQASDIIIGEPRPYGSEPTVSSRPLTVSFAANEEGMQQILLFTQLAGLLTVGDALADDEIALLYASLEEENPVGIVSLEQFLSLDLLRYARDSHAAEDQLQRSLPSPAFGSALKSVTKSSLLLSAQRVLLGDFGRQIEEKRLWPVQFLLPQWFSVEAGGAPGWYKVSLQLSVLERVGE